MTLKGLLRPRVLVVLALMVLVAAGFVACRDKGDATSYRTENVDHGDIAQTVSANGTLNPVTLVSVGTQVSGTITDLYVDFNDRVEAGQILMRLDDALLRAALQQSEANYASAQSALRLAQSDVERIAPLAKDGFVSQQELDRSQQALKDAQAKVAQTNAQVKKDRTNLDYAVIRSPVSGVVVSRAVDAGQTVAASFNTPELFKIARDLREMQIDAYFSEADIGQIVVGTPVSFRVDAFSGRRFAGIVKQIRLNPKNESNVVSYNVVVNVDNADQKLLPGMTAYVDIKVQEKDGVLRVPNSALRFKPTDESRVVKAAESSSSGKSAAASAANGGDESGNGERRRSSRAGGNGRVYVLRDGKLHEVRVAIGITDRRYTELRDKALKAGDAVVVGEGEGAAGAAGGSPRGMQFGM
ncbi:MAG TPA: efflux RND transporter periplasmic adaptor subunit [Moraxellaceae bacterium]|nr:efflux RND transporter periplasmic adaptor subunit [Moraxellaceae bacterium]